jgi:cyclopropane fatty-acyl-phospholipid synthase-like methyltransferase
MSAIASQEIVAKNAELWSIRARDWAAAQDRDERADFIEGVRRTGIGSGTSVLDLGCGTGGFSRRAPQAGASVTGIDVAPGMVAARERVPSGHFEMHYEFPDGATLLQGIRSAGPTILAERVVGVNAVKETILRAAAPYRTAEGGYRVELEWAFVLAEV